MNTEYKLSSTIVCLYEYSINYQVICVYTNTEYKLTSTIVVFIRIQNIN